MILLLTEGQVSDYRGAATLLTDLPEADVLIADKGYESDWFREALTVLEITPCIPGRTNRKAPVPYDADLYKQRNRIERMFGRSGSRRPNWASDSQKWWSNIDTSQHLGV